MHSKAKLALAVLTSPSAAFEEILDRRLIGTGLVIVAAAGTLSVIGTAARAAALGPVHYFALGRYNPVAWFGLFLLYALALQKLLKWLGTEIDYVRVALIMGWAQVSLLIVEALAGIGGIVSLGETPTGIVGQFIDAAGAVLRIGYVALIGVGLRTATGSPTSRGIMSYVVIAFAAVIAFSVTYANSRLKFFETALPGIKDGLAPQVAASDATPWLAASAVGLVLGILQLGKELGWDASQRIRTAATAGLIGAALFGGYLYGFANVDYYGRLIAAQRDYDLDKLDRAADELKSLLSASKIARPLLILDIADIYFLSGKPRESIDYYEQFARIIREAELGEKAGPQLARSHSGIGAVYDRQGKYDLAVKQFEQAKKGWPEFRDPWVRLAVTYDRMGDYKKAVEAADHAIKKLESKAPVAYVALIEAHAGLADTAKANVAYEKLKGLDDELAKRIDDKPEAWKVAVNKLTPKDLRFPLEKDYAPKPRQ